MTKKLTPISCNGIMKYGKEILMRKVLLYCMCCCFVLLSINDANGGIPGFMRARMGILKGDIQLPGIEMPEEGLIVSFFDKKKGPPPTEAGMHRVPEMVVRSDGKGHFSVSLLPGKYYMGVMLRKRGVGPGPPRPGEKFFFAMSAEHKLDLFTVETKKVNDLKKVSIAAPDQIEELQDFVTITGRVVDESGAPFSGALILVKDNPAVARPLFISAPSDKEGNYQIKLPPDTTYYLVARQRIQGGRPLPGSYVGTFGKNAPTQGTGQESIGAPAGVAGQGGEGEALPVSGKKGTVMNKVNITMFKVPDPEANRKKYQKTKVVKPESPNTVAH